MTNIKADIIGIVGNGTVIQGDLNIYQRSPTGKPLQRPSRAVHFTNRKDELKKLLSDLQPGKVVTLCGPGGIGKSALAAEAVWTLAPGDDPPELFGDGIIFHNFYNQPQVDLALENIVRAFGDEAKPTPRAAAQRVLANKRLLLLLDGAENADDLRAILELRDRCAVLVTSRARRDAIDERQEVRPLEADEAVKLLLAWGKERAADDSAARQICRLLGYLPLAVRLAGRYLDEFGESASGYLAWLQQTPLDALDQGQRRQESVPILLQKSLAQVSQTACDVLAIVGLLALAPFTRTVLAAALAVSEKELRRPLDELVNYGLLLHHDQWYELSHALIHTYASEKLRPAPEAVQRLTTYYNDFAREQRKKGLPGYALLDAQRGHFMQVLGRCVQMGELEAAGQLAWAVEDYLDVQGHLAERIIVNETGLQIARQSKDRREEGAWLGNLGNAYSDLGQVEQAIKHYQQALAIHREIGYRQGEAAALGNLGLAYSALGQVEQAIDYHQQALVIDREIGYRQGEAADLGNLGLAYRDLGQVEQAIDYLKQALVIDREIGYRQGEASALGNLGLAYRDLGQVEQAIDYHQQALAIHREIGYRQGEANQLGNLGNAYRALGQVEQAIDCTKEALIIFAEIKSPYAEQARRQLAELEKQPSPQKKKKKK
ncbi:tetratricopeptide repeat protein [candidate division KSB1 bacterium]|nr:tetratricopeptide repeat protein [candidate division KSB1 bacterium]RQW02497.1 MAG: tetratricopeptide repeat protein [candidate division KSB1 bacterium]